MDGFWVTYNRDNGVLLYKFPDNGNYTFKYAEYNDTCGNRSRTGISNSFFSINV